MGLVRSQKRKAPRGAGLWRGHNKAEQVVNLGFGGEKEIRTLVPITRPSHFQGSVAVSRVRQYWHDPDNLKGDDKRAAQSAQEVALSAGSDAGLWVLSH